MLTDRQTDKRTDGITPIPKGTGQIKQMELHQFQKEPSYDGDLSPCQV